MEKPDITINDSKIRPALRSQILSRQSYGANTEIIEELGICRGRVRIDMAVINGVFHGYEIKSDRDSLDRLSGQIGLYGKVLDFATLVVGDHNIRSAFGVLPSWWGILRILPDTETPSFHVLRQEQKNTSIDPRALVELLWRDEAIELLAQRRSSKDVRDKPRRFVWDRVCEYFSVEEIAKNVRAKLIARAKRKFSQVSKLSDE